MLDIYRKIITKVQ